MCIKNMVLCAAVILGTASPIMAAGLNGSSDELRQCIAKLQASGRNFGGNPETTGMTAYDEVAARCLEQSYRKFGKTAR